MKRVLATELAQHPDRIVRVRGWLNNLRPLGKLNFLILRDRSGLIQVVISDKEELQKVKQLAPGSVLTVTAKVASTNQAEMGIELIEPTIEVEVPISLAPPVEYYKPEIPGHLEFILDNRPIALRNRQIQAVFKIQAALTHAYRLFMVNEVGAVEYFAPNLIGASSEGGAEFFTVDYFGHTATLAQSSQLYKQIMVGVNERVFALMPFFRAEPSHTTRHVTEGKQFEFEIGFFDDWHEILDIQERCIKLMVQYVQNTCKHELETLGNPLIKAPMDVPFPRLTFKEAQEIYFQRTGTDERHEPDLSPAAERELCQYANEKYGTDLVFITDWLTEKRPFYAYPKPDNPKLTNTFDLLCAGMEITSGGQRRHTYESMLDGIKHKEMNPADFEDYLSIFKYGMPPHGGFGMGLERLTMTLLRIKNIRETSLFPSDTKRIAGVRLKAKIFFGSENIRNEIIRKLRDQDIDYKHLSHEATTSSEDSAKVRGTKIEEGVKSIILKGKNSKKNYQFNVPAHKKLDMKAVADATGEKCEFEAPDVILECYGLAVGSVPPFGELLNLDTYYDDEIQKFDKVAFNCGLVTESIVMKGKDLIRLVQPKFGKFSKE